MKAGLMSKISLEKNIFNLDTYEQMMTFTMRTE